MQTSWLNTLEYPFESKYFQIGTNKLHYIDEGDSHEVIVFVHGTPTWSYDFRHIINRLKNRYRCIAIDHLGFGLSDKPEHFHYSTQTHSHHLETFLLAKKIKNITLVLHDFGGPIGCDVAIKHPDLIQKIVIINSWLWSAEQDPEYKKLKKVLKSPLLPFLYKYLNFSVKYIMPNSFGKTKLSGNELRQYIMPFAKRSERNATLGFAHSLLNDQQWFESLWRKKDVLRDKPFLLLWGMQDPIVKPNNLHKFQEGLNNTTTVEFPECGHFPHVEEPDKVVHNILSWMKSH